MDAKGSDEAALKTPLNCSTKQNIFRLVYSDISRNTVRRFRRGFTTSTRQYIVERPEIKPSELPLRFSLVLLGVFIMLWS